MDKLVGLKTTRVGLRSKKVFNQTILADRKKVIERDRYKIEDKK